MTDDKIVEQKILTRQKNYKKVFETEEGQSVLADLYNFCGMKSDPFVGGEPDTTSYNLGRISIGRRIASILGQDEKEIQAIAKIRLQEEVYNPLTFKHSR